MIHNFQEVKIFGKKSYTCSCGKRVRRSMKFYQTLNPFNVNSEGKVKTSDEIYAEITAEMHRWQDAGPEPCRHTEE